MKPKALVLPPESRLVEVCSEPCRQLIGELFDPIWNVKGTDYSEQELAEMVEDAEVILTSWGSPILTDAMLAKAHKLRAIGHAAGTIKGRMPKEIFAKGIRVYSAAPRIAQSVGEYCLMAMMTMLRRIPTYDAGVRNGGWKITGLKGRELSGSTIGIVSASSTAKALIALLAPFHMTILIYDPYLSEETAIRLNARRATLEEVMQCPIISIHAPSLPSTLHMITGELTRLIPDDAVVVNSSRGAVFEEAALIEELGKGRFWAALDVFEKEPIKADHPFLSMSNVLLSPHIAGNTVEGHLALMHKVVDDIQNGFAGKPTTYEVSEKMWDTMA